MSSVHGAKRKIWREPIILGTCDPYFAPVVLFKKYERCHWGYSSMTSMYLVENPLAHTAAIMKAKYEQLRVQVAVAPVDAIRVEGFALCYCSVFTA